MPKILIIEDETFLRQEVVEWLMLEDYEALSAQDGMAGIETALREQPDLIVSDIRMPHLDGYSVLLEIRGNSTTASTPFIFITARAAKDDIRKGIDLGADGYITKPFTRLEFLQTVQTLLAKKRA